MRLASLRIAAALALLNTPKETPAMLTGTLISRLCVEVFAGNVTAGWWTDLVTGESLVGKRNVGELLMLVTTEISEAAEGWDGDLPDDKLPHRRMFEVELADAAIRVFDIGGGLSLDLGVAFEALRAQRERGIVHGAGTPFNLLLLVSHVSAAMEGYRKDRESDLLPGRKEIEVRLALLLIGIADLAAEAGCDLLGAIEEKRAFNATRADHQVENRRAAGGKRC